MCGEKTPLHAGLTLPYCAYMLTWIVAFADLAKVLYSSKFQNAWSALAGGMHGTISRMHLYQPGYKDP